MTAADRLFAARVGLEAAAPAPETGETLCWRPVLPNGFMPCLQPFGHPGRCSL